MLNKEKTIKGETLIKEWSFLKNVGITNEWNAQEHIHVKKERKI